MKKDLLTLRDITRDDLEHIFELASKLKAERGKTAFTPLAGKSVGLIFAKSSTRTRVSFEVGVGELGGRPLYLDQSRMQVGRGETVADTAKVLSRYLHGIVIRTFSHADVEELAREASIPVINALTDEYHPCQILADMLNVPLRTVDKVDSSLGSAMLAGVAVGVFASHEDAVSRCVRTTGETLPNPEGVAFYNRHFPIYRQIQQALAPVYHQM